MANASFGSHFDKVEDRNAGCLTAGSGCGRDRNQGLERARNRLPFSDRRIDIIKKVGGIGRVEVGSFGRVHC